MGEDHLNYLYSLERFGIQPGLERIERLMDVLDHPEQKFKIIHVAGTNGKGSTVAMLDSVLRQTGLSVGMYTSPDLYTFHERIRFQGKNISDEDLRVLIARVRTLCDMAGIQPTFFEFATAVAFTYFAEAHVDIAVVEVGMGGRLDATNVITPQVAVITNIGWDHMEHLGDTKQHITREKAGIIKPGVDVVTAEKEHSPLYEIRARCKEVNARLYMAHEMVSAAVQNEMDDRQLLKIDGAFSGELTLPLLGLHQVQNVVAVLGILHVLSKHGVHIPWSRIVNGIAETRWEGRLDVVSRLPLIIADGAHNIDGARALRAYLEGLPRRDVLLFGCKQGKQYQDIARVIVPLFTTVIVTEGSYQPEDANTVASTVRRYCNNIRVIPDVARAIEEGKEACDLQGMMCITGSLYLVGDALAILRGKPAHHRTQVPLEKEVRV